MTYSFDLDDGMRDSARQIAEILKGANPGDVPFRQATKFQLVIHVKTAMALGLEVPSTLLLRADEVIE
jgi:putative tryptophan/tyrosine transport system substrate-binding protein